jgi:hypothetical protein
MPAIKVRAAMPDSSLRSDIMTANPTTASTPAIRYHMVM